MFDRRTINKKTGLALPLPLLIHVILSHVRTTRTRVYSTRFVFQTRRNVFFSRYIRMKKSYVITNTSALYVWNIKIPQAVHLPPLPPPLRFPRHSFLFPPDFLRRQKFRHRKFTIVYKRTKREEIAEDIYEERRFVFNSIS